MYRKLLATLDGSPASEAVLPYLTELVRVLSPEEVVLVNVAETGEDRDVHLAEGYLESVASRLKGSWETSLASMPDLRWEALEGWEGDASISSGVGEAAGGILRFARDNQIYLIVMSTHGRTGFRRWLMGSVAEQLLKSAEVPIFLVRASEEPPTQSIQLKRILVPLDGSPLGEQCLFHVAELAKHTPLEVMLLNVAPGPGGERADASSHDMVTYLEHLASGLQQSGLLVEVRVRKGQSSEEILQESQESAIDLVVMTSHGRAGLGRLALGSVAHNVLSNSTTPVLLVRAKAEAVTIEFLQSPLVYRCHHCGHRIYPDSLSSTDRCGVCHYHLKACGNCINFDGMACVLQLPDASEIYPGNQCQRFEYRRTRLVS